MQLDMFSQSSPEDFQLKEKPHKWNDSISYLCDQRVLYGAAIVIAMKPSRSDKFLEFYEDDKDAIVELYRKHDMGTLLAKYFNLCEQLVNHGYYKRYYSIQHVKHQNPRSFVGNMLTSPIKVISYETEKKSYMDGQIYELVMQWICNLRLEYKRPDTINWTQTTEAIPDIFKFVTQQIRGINPDLLKKPGKRYEREESPCTS